MSQSKKQVAVFFGGRSPEHDVSVVTGLQVLQAIDQSRYSAFPVYINPAGHWLTGDVLRERGNYLISPENRAKLRPVSLDLNVSGKGRLIESKSGLFSKPQVLEFDIAIPSFHGSYGEDGQMQGVFELAGIPYTGMRTMASAILMDKGATKKFLQGLDIPVLPYVTLKRPRQGLLIPKDQLAAVIKGFDFPCIIKPSHLGSSIGVAKVNNIEELAACLPAIFESDDSAILEPYVQNLVEYNVAVSKVSGKIRTSALERPKTTDELLDFKQKYLSGGGTKSGTKSGGTKSGGQISQGMLSLTRELNPSLPAGKEAQIREWSARMFEAIDGTGAPRIDYIGNSKTGEIWLNEVNPCPGSFGYFLWEALAQEPLLFTELLTLMLEEALYEKGRRNISKDPVPVDARLFKR